MNIVDKCLDRSVHIEVLAEYISPYRLAHSVSLDIGTLSAIHENSIEWYSLVVGELGREYMQIPK